MLSTKPPRIRSSSEATPGSYKVAPASSTPHGTWRGRATTVTGRDFSIDRPPSRPIPWLGLGLLIGGGATGLALSIRHDLLLGQIAAPLLGLAGLHGLWRGGLRKAVMLPITVGILYLVSIQPDFADPVIRAMTGKSSTIGNWIACGVAVALTLIIARSIVGAVQHRMVTGRPVVRAANNMFGTGIGLAEGAFAMLCLCWATVLVEPQARTVRDHPNAPPDSIHRQLAGGLVRLAGEIDQSPLEPIIRDANLLEYFPALRDAVQELSLDERMGLGAVDPQLRNRAIEWLRNAPPDRQKGLDAFFTKQMQQRAQREAAYDRLPPPKNDRR